MVPTNKEETLIQEEVVSQVLRIPRVRIRRFEVQPRDFFDPKDMEDLVASISEIGQQQPIVVRTLTGNADYDYELVDGDRCPGYTSTSPC